MDNLANTFDLNGIRAVDAVARTGGFRQAAASLRIAQSSISQQISRLEDSLGQKLFERTTRRVSLTPAGEALLLYGRAMLSLAEQARRQFDQPSLRGVLRIGIVEDLALVSLHRVLALFRRQHPNFGLSFRTGLSSDLLRALDDDELDLALVKRAPGRRQGELVLSQPLVWVGHPELIGSSADPVMLATYPAPSETRDVMLAALKEAGRSWVIVAESVGIAGLKACVEAGLGVAAFSEAFVPQGLVVLTQDVGLPKLGLLDYVLDQRHHPQDEALSAFSSLMSEIARSCAAGGQEGEGMP